MGLTVKAAAAAMAALFALGAVAGAAYADSLGGLLSPGRQLRELLEHRPLLAALILSNNLRVLLILALSSFTVVGPGAIMLINGVIIGAVLALAARKLPPSALLLSVLPHGIVEVPAFIYAAAVSTTFGLAVWRRALKREPGVGAAAVSYVKALIVSAALIVAAALIEAFVTPTLVEPLLAP